MILFHLKSFFRSQDIKVFDLTFSSCRKNGLMRKIRLISKLIAVHTLPDISRSKSNRPVKFGQLINYNKRYNFLQKSCRKCGRGSLQTTFLFLFLNIYMRWIQVADSHRPWHTTRTNCIKFKNIDPEICSFLIF